MIAAIVTLVDKKVLAVWRDDNAIAFPIAPTDCEYLNITQAIYDELSEPINSTNHLVWYLRDDGAGSFVVEPNLRDRHFYADVLTSDRSIVSLDTGIPDFFPADMESVEISQSDYVKLNGGSLTWDADLQVPKWSADASGVIALIPDVRDILKVSHNQEAVANVAYPIDFRLEDSKGVLKSSSGPQEILVREPGQIEAKCISVQLTAGIAAVTPSFPSGIYTIATADSKIYRVDGDIDIVVAEAWT